MSMHEWLIQRVERYEVTPDLHQWLSVYKGVSNKVSKATTDRFSISRPVANRAIAPTGSIGILAGSSTGIEPLFAVSYKRRYLRGFTCYLYGFRGGQPLTSVPYSEAVEKLGEEFDEHVETHDICDISGTGSTCGALNKKRLGCPPSQFYEEKMNVGSLWKARTLIQSVHNEIRPSHGLV